VTFDRVAVQVSDALSHQPSNHILGLNLGCLQQKLPELAFAYGKEPFDWVVLAAVSGVVDQFDSVCCCEVLDNLRSMHTQIIEEHVRVFLVVLELIKKGNEMLLAYGAIFQLCFNHCTVSVDCCDKRDRSESNLLLASNIRSLASSAPNLLFVQPCGVHRLVNKEQSLLLLKRFNHVWVYELLLLLYLLLF